LRPTSDSNGSRLAIFCSLSAGFLSETDLTAAAGVFAAGLPAVLPGAFADGLLADLLPGFVAAGVAGLPAGLAA